MVKYLLGYDAAGTFNERFAFKPNGALAIGGNLGSAGQVLSSNGSGAVSWTNVKPSFFSFKQTDYQLDLTPDGSSPGEPAGWYVMGGLHYQAIIINQTSTVKLSVKLPVQNTYNTFGNYGNCAVYLGLYDPSNNYIQYEVSYMYVGDGTTLDGMGVNFAANLPAGTYHTHVKVYKYVGDNLHTGWYYTGWDTGTLVAEVFPQ